MQLHGVFLRDGQARALIAKGGPTAEEKWMESGAKIGDWTLTAILPDGIRLEADGRSVPVPLRENEKRESD